MSRSSSRYFPTNSWRFIAKEHQVHPEHQLGSNLAIHLPSHTKPEDFMRVARRGRFLARVPYHRPTSFLHVPCPSQPRITAWIYRMEKKEEDSTQNTVVAPAGVLANPRQGNESGITPSGFHLGIPGRCAGRVGSILQARPPFYTRFDHASLCKSSTKLAVCYRAPISRHLGTATVSPLSRGGCHLPHPDANPYGSFPL